MGPKDCKNNEKKKPWQQLSTWGTSYSKKVKIAHVEVDLRSLYQCLKANSSSR